MILVTKWFGVFLCDDHDIKKFELFPKDAKIIAKKLAAIRKGEILPEEKKLAQKKMQVAELRLSELGRPVNFDSSFIKAEDYGFSEALMREAMLELGKMGVKESVHPDRCVLQAIRAVDDINESINVINERLHEWYGLYFPELSDYAKDMKYVKLIAKFTRKEEIMEELGVDLESLGGQMSEEDIQILREVAESLDKLYQVKEGLQKYIADIMKQIAPNLAALLSPSLAARLISLAGGLERLSKLPSSTVQLLGAEKAMFLHLRNHKKPPKHGVIYQHPIVHKAPYWQRGKLARSLASKIAIAAKIDYWQGEYIGDKLIEELEKRKKEIEEKYPTAPRKHRKKG